MKLNTHHFKKLGLNIFAAVEVAKLPTDILDMLSIQNIPFTEQDTLCIIGNGGRDLWEQLKVNAEDSFNPIDGLSLQQMTVLDTDARILFPHPKWNIPLQRIGRFLNISRQSLLGIDINQEYGLWFAFRGAFLTKLKIKEIKYEAFSSPCETCVTKPCINACPASAINLIDKKFKLNLCSEYQLKLDSSCTDRCLARMSCPYQIKHQYKLDQIQYHMKRKFDLLT